VNDRTLPELARHYVAAVPLADRAIAVDTSMMAAESAIRAFAYEDAVELLERVLPLVDEPVARAELMLRLAAANLPAGNIETVRRQSREVADAARREGKPELFRRAALLFENATWRLGLPGGDAERLLREALADATDEGTRIHLLAARGRALALSGEPAAGIVIEEAIAAARRHGEKDVLRFALHTWFNIPWNPATYSLMLDRAHELRVLAAGGPDTREAALAQQWLIGSLMVNGHFDELRDAAEEHRRQVDRSREPFQHHLRAAGDSVLALMAGDFAQAEAAADAANEMAAVLSGTDTSGAYGVQMFSLRREQGRLDEIRPVVEAVVRLNRAHAAWRPGLAAVYAELGMLDEARAEINHLVDPGLTRIPRDALYAGCLTYLADAIYSAGDRRAAAAVYAALEPYRGTVVCVGHTIACYGAADRYLGALAETAGRARDAERHYVRAIEIDTAIRAPVWLAHSKYRYARFLARQGRRDGARRAAALAADVIATTSAFGMRALDSRAVALAAALDIEIESVDQPAAAITRLAVDLTGREREILACLVDGLSNAEIGKALHCSPNTAANHVRSILMKTGCANRTEAAAWAVRNGLVAN
jgi:DNA-binding CsgD family transcriptional regulator